MMQVYSNYAYTSFCKKKKFYANFVLLHQLRSTNNFECNHVLAATKIALLAGWERGTEDFLAPLVPSHINEQGHLTLALYDRSSFASPEELTFISCFRIHRTHSSVEHLVYPIALRRTAIPISTWTVFPKAFRQNRNKDIARNALENTNEIARFAPRNEMLLPSINEELKTRNTRERKSERDAFPVNFLLKQSFHLKQSLALLIKSV